MGSGGLKLGHVFPNRSKRNKMKQDAKKKMLLVKNLTKEHDKYLNKETDAKLSLTKMYGKFGILRDPNMSEKAVEKLKESGEYYPSDTITPLPLVEEKPADPAQHSVYMPPILHRRVIEQLIEKYGDDYDKMFWDIKINKYQWTVSEIKRKVQHYNELLQRETILAQRRKQKEEEEKQWRQQQRKQGYTFVSTEAEIEKEKQEEEAKLKNLEFPEQPKRFKPFRSIRTGKLITELKRFSWK